MTKDRNALGLRPLTARSVMLSTLLGTHPPRLPVRTLVKAGELFDIPEGTVRVALSRMAADGEITADNGTYHLTGPLLDRAARQDESRAPGTRRWTGAWTLAVVTATGRSATDRTAFRRAMTGLRLAERREGVWMRPANLAGPDQLPEPVVGQCLWFEGRSESDPHALVRELWDLDAWSERARRLLDALTDASDLADEFVVSAAVLRHLLADPVLPPDLLPADWPGPDLRRHYATFDTKFRRRLRTFLRN